MVNLFKADLHQLSKVMCAKYHNLARHTHAHKVTFAAKNPENVVRNFFSGMGAISLGVTETKLYKIVLDGSISA